MKEDVEYLIQSIKEVNPNLSIQKQINQYDILARINAYKNKIDSIQSPEEFFLFIRTLLQFCADPHCSASLIRTESPFYTDSLVLINRPYFQSMPQNQQSKQIYFTYCYFFGEKIFCFEKNTFRYRKKQKKIVDLKPGWQICSINNKPPSSYIYASERKKKWAESHTYQIPVVLPMNSRTFSFISKGKTYTLDPDKLSYESTDVIISFKPGVQYQNEILYLRIPAMDMKDLPYYQEKIHEVKHKPIKRIILDVRGNQGGNDLLWEEVLSLLVPDTLWGNTKMVLLNSPLVKTYLSHMWGADYVNTLTVEKIDWLENQEFFVLPYNKHPEVVPDSNSIRFQGKIVLLQDEGSFSSSLALLAVAKRNPNQFVTIGFTNNWIGSRCITPFYLVLPHSKITYRLNS